MLSNSRIVLSDFIGYPKQYYHATFCHLTHKHDGSRHPVALLKNIYLVDENDERLESAASTNYLDEDNNGLIADHLWMDFSKNWFVIPQELLSGDEIFFKAAVEKYKIARKDILRRRDLIWKEVKQENTGIFNAWQGVKHNLKGAQYQARYEQMRAHIQSNNEMARLRQQSIPLVDYTLTDPEFKIIYYDNESENRVKYDLKQFQNQRCKYTSWLAARSLSFEENGKIF